MNVSQSLSFTFQRCLDSVFFIDTECRISQLEGANFEAGDPGQARQFALGDPERKAAGLDPFSSSC